MDREHSDAVYTRVLRGHVEEDDGPGAETVASGMLRLRPAGLPRRLATLRGGGQSSAGRIAAIARFDALFLGALWDFYGRRFAGLRSVPPYLRRRPGKPR